MLLMRALEKQLQIITAGADLEGGCRGCAPPPPWDDLRFSNTTGFLQKKKSMWFIGVEVEQETSALPPKKNPGSAPVPVFLDLLTIYVPILYLPTFCESNAWDFHLFMTGISGNDPAYSEYFRRISEDFRTLPKFKCTQIFRKTLEHFRSYLKNDNFRVLWFR